MAKVLIIDADQKTAEQVLGHLRAQGHHCRIEPLAERAIDVADRKSPDLFVLDVMLPGTGGFEVCRRIRRHPALYTTPILVLSAMSDAEELEHALAQGADEFLAKPCNPDQLVNRVEALLVENAGCLVPDKITGLPNAKRIRRELQRRVSDHRTFALAYLELMNLRAFAREYGAASRDKAISSTAKALEKRLKELDDEDWSLGHMGGGHFVCMLTPGDAEFCDARLRASCQKRFEKLYESLGVARPHAHASASGAPGAPPALDILLCMTKREGKTPVTPQKLFETLTQIRQKVQAEHIGGGVHIDARRN